MGGREAREAASLDASAGIIEAVRSLPARYSDAAHQVGSEHGERKPPAMLLVLKHEVQKQHEHGLQATLPLLPPPGSSPRLGSLAAADLALAEHDRELVLLSSKQTVGAAAMARLRGCAALAESLAKLRLCWKEMPSCMFRIVWVAHAAPVPDAPLQWERPWVHGALGTCLRVCRSSSGGMVWQLGTAHVAWHLQKVESGASSALRSRPEVASREALGTAGGAQCKTSRVPSPPSPTCRMQEPLCPQRSLGELWWLRSSSSSATHSEAQVHAKRSAAGPPNLTLEWRKWKPRARRLRGEAKQPWANRGRSPTLR